MLTTKYCGRPTSFLHKSTFSIKPTRQTSIEPGTKCSTNQTKPRGEVVQNRTGTDFKWRKFTFLEMNSILGMIDNTECDDSPTDFLLNYE